MYSHVVFDVYLIVFQDMCVNLLGKICKKKTLKSFRAGLRIYAGISHHTYILVYIAVVCFDMPYGITDEHWDNVHDKGKLLKILKQVGASQELDKYVIVLYHHIRQSQTVYEAMTEVGCKSISNLYWHKTDHWTPTPLYQYTSSIEVLTIGFIPNVEESQVRLPEDPKLRMNFIQCPSVSPKSEDANGIIVNPCEKPPDIMHWICGNHCMPGQNVLVIGSGANGDVKGAVMAGCNVVAVESDKRQYECVSSILVPWEAKMIKQMEVERLSQSALKKSSQLSQQSAQPEVGAAHVSSNQSTVAVELFCIVCGEKFEETDIHFECADDRCGNLNSIHHSLCGVDDDEQGLRYCMDHAPDTLLLQIEK